MRKFKWIACMTMLMAVSFSTFAHAAEEVNGDLSLEEGAQVYVESAEDRMLRERKEAELNDEYGISMAAASYTKLNVPVFVQSEDWYCGPATVKQVVHYIKGSSQSQAYYAHKDRLNTTENGTDMTKIPGVVNAAIGEKYYVYDEIASRAEWDKELPQSLVKRRPAILDINTMNVPAFPYRTKGHFVCLSGEDAITSDGDGYFFQIADPINKSGGGLQWYLKDDLYKANVNHFRAAYIW
nr:C39 family peptidase [uncultured Acetatifactor sp.]